MDYYLKRLANVVIETTVDSVKHIIDNNINNLFGKPVDVLHSNNNSYKRKKIPKTLKQAVWNKHIGENIGKTTCIICKNNYITQMSFHCSHIIAESLGGDTTLDNLLPTCATCNLSCGKMNLSLFKNTYFK